MKTKQKRIAAIAAAALITITTVYAHSGGTDSSGGHYDRSTGEYHYHHGHPAHQHPNGICPYIHDKKASQSSGAVNSGTTSSASSTDTSRSYNYTSGRGTPSEQSHSTNSGRVSNLLSETATPTPTSKTDTKGKIFEGIIIFVFLFGVPIVYLILLIVDCINSKIKELKEKRRRSKLPPYIKPEIIIKRSYIKPELVIQAAPKRWNNIAIGEDRYPYDKTAPFGCSSQFTVFTIKSGRRYHRYYCSHLERSSYKSRHLYWALSNGYKPCLQCKPPSAVDPWYLELFPEKSVLRKYMREDIPETFIDTPE